MICLHYHCFSINILIKPPIALSQFERITVEFLLEFVRQIQEAARFVIKRRPYPNRDATTDSKLEVMDQISVAMED